MNRIFSFARSAALLNRVVASSRHWSRHATEPHLLFPALALLILGLIWGTTLNLVAIERVAAAGAAAKSSRQLAATYEAQVFRALREIDQTLKVVKYAVETTGNTSILADLKANALLLPDLLFVVVVTGPTGDIVASTRESLKGNVASREYFEAQRSADAFVVGVPRRHGSREEFTVEFSRRLTGADGRFGGIVYVSVDASYFVSGYEPEKFGGSGMLGLVGTDGIYRSRRTGDDVTAGDAVDYAGLMAGADEDGVVSIEGAVLDDKDRFTTAMKLYDMPLVVVVGLSRDEQFAFTDHRKGVYLWRATGVSVVVVALLVLLGRMSKALARGRERALAEQAMHAERVEHLAYHDALTSLPNRAMFSRLLAQGIAHARRHERRLAVLFLDLDRFKQINDTLRHAAGDQLLREVAIRLEACLRTSDTVARLGGDEFVALLPELDDQRYAATVALKILAVLAEPFVLMGQDVRVTASIGVSSYPSDGLDEATLTKNADIAMYQAKAKGKNNFQFYSAEVSSHTVERLSLEAALRHALERDELEIDYAPRCDVGGDGVTALEAVLRWRHPERGVIELPSFMPVAEEIGLVVPIGEWMLRTICAQQVAWARDGVRVPATAVHLGTRHLSDEHFLARLAGILEGSGMQPSRLEVVVGERQLMLDVQKTMRTLTGLRALGVRIAIDGFGGGYAALGTLRALPIDTIQIDRSVIRDIGRSAETRALAEAVVDIGRTLSLDVGLPHGAGESVSPQACRGLRAFHRDEIVPARCVPHRIEGRPQCEPAPGPG